VPQANSTRLSDHLLVAGQFVGIAICCYPGWHGAERYGYLILTLFGIVLGGYTLAHNRIGNFRVYPQVKATARLITSGPYKFVRHPMYLSLALIIMGIALYNGRGYNLIGFLLLLICINIKACREERFLLGKFPEYKKYKAKTSRIVPFI